MRAIIVKTWLILSIILLTSCGNDLPEEAKSLTAGDYLCLSEKELSFDAQNSTQTIRVASNTAWRATSSSDWLSLSQDYGSKDATVTVTSLVNEIAESRYGTIVFTSDDRKLSITMNVSQNAAAKKFTIDTNDISFTADAGSKTINVTSNFKWSATSNVDWLSLSRDSGSGNVSVTITASANPNTTVRQGKISFSNNYYVDVSQKGISPKLPINVDGVSFNMIRVDGGTFKMGATPEQGYDYDNDERPVHNVTLDGYYIGETEVTVELWYNVLGLSRPSYNQKNPVVNISWNELSNFIEKLNAKTGMKFRLLTEAEWEFAARGGNKSQGYKYAGSKYLNGIAWYLGNSGNSVHNVATKTPNELGLYDMSGNVWEYCQDYYGSYSSESVTNPKGPGSGITTRRVIRGGSWLYDGRGCRVSDRLDTKPGIESPDIGFRLGL